MPHILIILPQQVAPNHKVRVRVALGNSQIGNNITICWSVRVEDLMVRMLASESRVVGSNPCSNNIFL